ncbi:IS3 family transposase [Limosilactobacillus reuteri]|uniref:IS3 family transposase n=1 Tax=Limosilactobacillus reuteri TaxID=1598 RepID=UPI00051421B3|nr:IS3 family transposase [Limosilactobacillus reuteri]KGE71303.1 integrase [Limosilactobacillus reuteri]
MDQIRDDQSQRPKKLRYKIGDLLKAIGLTKATYHDERKRIARSHDKYEEAKAQILKIAQRFRFRERWTASYRRIQMELDQIGLHLAGDTIRKLMRELNVQVSLYNRHRNSKIADNRLKQRFNEKRPYHVIHTDITQVRLANHQWAYISAMIDEASQEILAFQTSISPNKELIVKTVEELITNLPDNAHPVIHSDQGWHYQLDYYTQKLADHQFIQSMSRKGNCLDNAPVESFFHLFKTELLAGFLPCKDIAELTELSHDYVQYFNHVRTTLKTKGMTPVEYRNPALAA